MHLITTPMLDRLAAEREIEKGAPIHHPAAEVVQSWLDDVRDALSRLQDTLDEAGHFKSDVRASLENVGAALNRGPEFR